MWLAESVKKMAVKFFIILLLSGMSAAHPQYQPGSGEDPIGQVGGTPEIPSQASDGSALTQQQQDGLKEFWSKVEGAFGAGAGGAAGLPQKDDDLSAQCLDLSYDCVPYFQCVDGVINTDGAGLIDVRIKPQATCTNPDYPEVPALCCRKPDHTGPIISPTTCSLYEECVDYVQCSEDGYIITDGSGLVDIRAAFKTCALGNGKTGRCCKPPPIIVDNCPVTSACVPAGECHGEALDSVNNFVNYVKEGSWSECSLKSNNLYGVCCVLPPPPTIEQCPANSFCTYPLECLGNALDLLNNFVPSVPTGSYLQCSHYEGDQQKIGVCCIPPPPKIIDQCPIDAVCLDHASCVGNALDGTGNLVPYDSKLSSWSQCNLGPGYDPGVCCIKSIRQPDLHPAAQCGIRNYHVDKRIQSNYAENEAAFGEFSWQTIIFFQNYTFKCGASLISNRHVLTAAHCVYNYLPSDLRLRFGEWQVNTFDEPLPYEDRNVYVIDIHPGFNPKNVHNDIAVLELEKPLTIQYHINTICLPDKAQIFYNGDQCIATGWGKDSFEGKFQHILKKIDLPFVEYDICQNYLRKTRLGKYFQLDKSFVCAGGEENKDACYGDGGGPLVCKNPATGHYVLAGITAWGIGCGTKDVPGVYANLQLLSSWVDEIVHGFKPHADIKDDVGVVGYGK